MVNRGVDSFPQYYTGYGLVDNNSYIFDVFNSGHRGIFRFKMASDPSPFNYSPTMNFNQGPVITNSEHYNSCDSMYTEMDFLNYYGSSGNWFQATAISNVIRILRSMTGYSTK